MRRCPSCQKQFPDDVQFCPEHGAPLNAPEPGNDTVAHADTVASTGAAPPVPRTVKGSAAAPPQAGSAPPPAAGSPPPPAGGSAPPPAGGYAPPPAGGYAPPPQAGVAAQEPPPPKKGGALKWILLIVIPLLLLGGIGTAVAVFRLDKKILDYTKAMAAKGDKDDDDKGKGKDKEDDKDDDDDDDDDDDGKKKSSAKDDDDDDDDDKDTSSSGGGSGTALAYISSKSMMAFVIPRMDRLQTGAGDLLSRFNGTPFSRAAITREVQREIGVDPFSASSLKSKGIDISKGVAIGMNMDESVVMAVAESDKDKLDAFLRTGASKSSSTKIKTWSLPGGGTGAALHKYGSDKPRVVWTHKKGYLVVCAGKSKTLKRNLEKVLSISGSKRLESNSTFKTLSAKVGKHDALLYLNGPEIKRQMMEKRKRQIAGATGFLKTHYEKKLKQEEMIFAYFNGLAMGARLEKKQATVRSYMAVPATARIAMRRVLEGMGGPVDLAKYLNAEPVAIYSLSWNFKAAMDMLQKVMPPNVKQEYLQGIQAIEQKTKLNINDDVFVPLSGRYAVAFFAPKARDIKKLIRSSRAEELLQWVGLARIKKPGKVGKVFSVAADLMAKNGLKLKTTKVRGNKVYNYKEPGKFNVAWTIANDQLVWGVPRHLKKTLKLMAGKGSPAALTDAARVALARKSALVLYLDAAKVLDLLKGIPGNREMQGVAAMLSPLGHVTLTADVEGSGIIMDLMLGYSGASAAAPPSDTNNSGGMGSTRGAAPVKAEASGKSTGIAECDDFLRKYERCVAKMPAAMRSGVRKSIATMWDSYRKGAAYPSARKTLARTCTRTAKTMAQAYARYNCKW